jgi:hypothetical protein
MVTRRKALEHMKKPAGVVSTRRRNTCQMRLLTVQSGLSQIHLPSPSSLDTPLNAARHSKLCRPMGVSAANHEMPRQREEHANAELVQFDRHL